jgi:hypothetical protein
MKRTAAWPVVVAAILACGGMPVRAQDDAEVAVLRQFLSIPQNATVTLTDHGVLPTSRPLKIYIATDDEPTAEEALKAIEELNRRHVGEFEHVSSRALADVILVQYEMREKRRLETENRLTMDPSLATRSAGGRTDPYYKSEIRGYVVVHNGNAYSILERYKKSVRLGEKRPELRNAFQRVVKRSADD